MLAKEWNYHWVWWVGDFGGAIIAVIIVKFVYVPGKSRDLRTKKLIAKFGELWFQMENLIRNSVYKEGAEESSLFWWQIYEKYFNKEQADSAKLGFQTFLVAL